MNSSALTPAERLVMSHVCGGLSNKEIAKALGRSPSTIQAHLHSVYTKLAVRSRKRAADIIRSIDGAPSP